MGQKVNPYGYRLGITQDWKSKWFSPRDSYADTMLEDHKIRKFIGDQMSAAGLKEIEIHRAVSELNITIRVSRPGMVIGKKGAGIQQLEQDLHEITKSKVKLAIEEVKVPELEAALVADYISRQMNRRMPYRRVVQSAIRSAMDKGAKGAKIRVSGVLSGGNTIARTEVYSEGSIPAQTLRADIDYAQLDCHRIFGIIGIKVWIYKGEKEPY
jgi:small subunit ribosomal protein S3